MWETPAVSATWRMLGRSEVDRVLMCPPMMVLDAAG